MSETRSSTESDLTVRLNYLDKRFAAFERIETGASRLTRLQVILSVLIIALATGLVSADENLELTGIKLKLPLWFLLGGGSIAAGLAGALAMIQFVHGWRVESALYATYTDLGFPTPWEDSNSGPGLASGLVPVVVAAGQERNSVVTIMFTAAVGVIVVVLPFAAQIVVLLKLGGTFGWSWHVWAPLGGWLLLTIATAVWAWRPR